MCKKLVYLISFVLVLSLTSNALTAEDPSLIIYYSFDEVGEIIADQSGKGHDGVVVGDITAEPGGKVNGAAKFEGTLGAAGESYLDLDGPSFPAEDIPTSGMTLAAWIKCENTGDHHSIFNALASDGTWLIHPEARSNGEFRWLLRASGMTTIFDIRSGVVPWGEWVHFAGIYDKASGKAYVYNNGELVGEANVGDPLDIAGDYEQGARVGYDIDNARPFTGLMDEFFLYNRALSQAEVQNIMQGLDFPYAFNPGPANGAMHEDTWATLSWSLGSSAVSHDVYFGDNLDDVKNGTGDTFQGNQIAAFLIVGFTGFAYPDGLVPGTTYYWRIDEIEADGTTRKGNIWSFTVPPKTAYNPAPPDGAEFVDLNMELSWTKGFGAISHTVYFGDNFDDVDNATGGDSQGGATYNPGTLELEKVYYWRVDEFDAAGTYKGDIWGFTTQGAVGSPNPSNGATGVKMTPTLSWNPADSAASHDVYFGADKDAVRNATTASPEYKGNKALGSESYDPGKIDWYATYYWRVDAVYNSGPVKGLAWSFTTADFLLIDDFEDYDAGNNEIWWAWKDGLGYAAHDTEPAYPGNGTGSAVGDEATPSYCEEIIVHGGGKSMPVVYDNNKQGYALYSEVAKTLSATRDLGPRDWTEEGVMKLSLWFRGDAANSAERMFVALNGSAVVYHNDPAVTQTGEWTEWVIGLQAFTDRGVDLTNVDTIAIGLGDKNNPQAGGSGKMYIDDIRLYRPAEPVDPGTEGLAAFYALDGDANDSSGNGNDGTISNLNGGLGTDGSVWVDDPERGTVISFNGTAEGAYVRAGDIPQMTLTNDFTWAFWAKHSDENTADNDIILGNRMDENKVDFVPRQFIKFTPTKFEWHMNGNGDDNMDYDDIPADVWLHHAVVKTGDQLTYYRNGIEASSGTITQALDFPQPLYFGGDNEAAAGENWSGLMSEVAIYNRALSGGEIRYLAGFRSTVEAGPVGHWTFDEGDGTTVVDISGNGNDGTLMDNPDLDDPTWIAGISGSALEFHGTGVAGTGGDHIDCGNDASLDITGPISIALWIRPDADDPEGKGLAGGETAPMAKATSDWSWQVRYGWGTPTPYMGFQFNTSPRSWVYVGKNLVRNEWCHIACSHDGTTLKCYLDGVETDSTPMGEFHSSADPVLIGSDGWGSDWIGAIDDVRIYDRALSEDEILDIVADL